MTDRTCSIAACERLARVRGWCSMHYTRWRRYGDPGEPIERKTSADASAYERVALHGWTEQPGGCWITNGHITRLGYGAIHVPDAERGRVKVGTHRVVFEHHNGPLLDGEVVRHACDNPPCINPDHLLRGSQADNVEDMWSRGRGSYGARHPLTLLSQSDIDTIRADYASGESTQQAIADRFGVSREHVGSIIRGRRRLLTEGEPHAEVAS